MSILAEPRRKQKISIDPQNLNWKNDDQKFSKKLMEKMGWNEGDGLGKNRQGDSNSVKLKANRSGKGLGADKLADYDSTWIAHHDDFADLLEALNKNKQLASGKTDEITVAAEKISIELKSKSIKRRIHYQKFTRAKDTSNYSENDKTAILGFGKLKKDKKVKQENDGINDVKKEGEEEEDEEDKKEGNNTVSSISVGDYFAAKMAALKAKKEAVQNNEIVVKVEVKEEIVDEKDEGEEDEEEERKKAEKKERKRLRREQREKEKKEIVVKEEVEEEITDEAERKRLKKEKKRLKRLHEQQNAEDKVEEAESVPTKRRKCEEDN